MSELLEHAIPWAELAVAAITASSVGVGAVYWLKRRRKRRDARR